MNAKNKTVLRIMTGTQIFVNVNANKKKNVLKTIIGTSTNVNVHASPTNVKEKTCTSTMINANVNVKNRSVLKDMTGIVTTVVVCVLRKDALKTITSTN